MRSPTRRPRTKAPRIERYAVIKYRKGAKAKPADTQVAAPQPENAQAAQNEQQPLAQPVRQIPPQPATPKPKTNPLLLFTVIILILLMLIAFYSISIPPSPFNETTTVEGNLTTTSGGGGPLSGQIGSAYCRYNGVGSDGFPLYLFGTTGAASGPTGGQIWVTDAAASEACSGLNCGITEAISCSDWSLGSTPYCTRSSSQAGSTSWDSSEGNNFLSGITLRFYVYGYDPATRESSLLDTTTATCQSCGDYPDQIRC